MIPLEPILSKTAEKRQPLRPAARRRKAAARLAEKYSLQFLFCARHFFLLKGKEYFSARLCPQSGKGGGASRTARGQKISSPSSPPFFARSLENRLKKLLTLVSDLLNRK